MATDYEHPDFCIRPRRIYSSGADSGGSLERIPSSVTTILADVGISMRPSGRLAQSLTVVEEAAAFIQSASGRFAPDLPDPTWAFVCGEMSVAEAVLAEFRDEPASVQKIVGAIEESQLVPPPPGSFDHGRDIFAEYVVAANFKSAGMPVRFEEPDLLFHAHGHWFSVAVKRINSTNPRAIESQFAKARDQIYRSKRPGVVALELSNLAQDMIKPSSPVTAVKFSEMRLRLQDEVFEKFVIKLAKSSKNVKSTFGIMSFHTVAAWLPAGGVIAVGHSVATRRLCPDRSRRAEQLIKIGDCVMEAPFPRTKTF